MREAAADRAFEIACNLMENADSETVRLAALTFISNRAEGLPTAKQELSGPEGAPLSTTLQVKFCDADGDGDKNG